MPIIKIKTLKKRVFPPVSGTVRKMPKTGHFAQKPGRGDGVQMPDSSGDFIIVYNQLRSKTLSLRVERRIHIYPM